MTRACNVRHPATIIRRHVSLQKRGVSQHMLSPAKLTLNITYTESYPEEAPEWKLIEAVDVDDDIVEGCRSYIEETVLFISTACA